MSTINIYHGAFTHTYETIHETENKAIKDSVKDDLDNAVIFVDGFKKDKNYILKDDELCTIRTFPQKADNTFLNIVTLGGWGITNAIVKTLSGKDIMGWLIEWLTDDSDSPQQPDSLESIPQLRGAKNQSGLDKPFPFVMGKHLLTPYYIGKPYTIISGEDGEDQYFHALFILGYSKLEVTNIKLGEIDLCSNWDRRYNGALIPDGQFSDNNPKLELQQGSNEVSLYSQKVYEEQLSIELMNVEGKDNHVLRFSAKNPKKVEIEFTFTGGLISYNDEGSKIDASVSIIVEWRQGPDDPQGWREFGRIGTNGGLSPTSYDPATHKTTITRQKAKVMRFIASKTFSQSEIIDVPGRVVELRIVRDTLDDPGDTRTSDTVYLSAIRTWCFDYDKSKNSGSLVPQVPMIAKDRDRTCRLGIELKADDRLTGMIDAINCIVQSCGRTWNGTSWTVDSLDADTPTQNPASIVLKAMQSQMLGVNKYADNEDGTNNKIDLDSFGEFYEWCNEIVTETIAGKTESRQRFTCNGVLTTEKRLDEFLDAVLMTGRGMKVLHGSKYGILIDKPRYNPVTILNSQNILEVSNQKNFEDLPDGYKIKFIDESDGYQENELYAMKDGGNKPDPDSVIENIEMPFVTNLYQVFKNGLYQYACRKLRPEVWNRKLSVDGNLLSIGCLVEVQDDTILVGMGEGAEIKELVMDGDYIVGIKTDGVFDITDISQQYGVKITQFDGVNPHTIRTAEVVIPEIGTYYEFTFVSAIGPDESPKPSVGDIVSFGIFDRITTDALCFGKKDNGDGTFDVVLIPYAEGVYTADAGDTPEFDSKITPPQGIHSPQSFEPPPVSKEELYETIGKIFDGAVDVDSPDNVSNLQAVAGRDVIQITWSLPGGGLNNTIKQVNLEINKGDGNWIPFTASGTEFIYTFDRTTDGYPEKSTLTNWKIRAKAENVYGKQSLTYAGGESGMSLDLFRYGTWIPAIPSVVFAKAEKDGIRISITHSKQASYYGDIEFFPSIEYLEEPRQTSSTKEPQYFYSFDRSLDGYPEKSDIPGSSTILGNYAIQVRVTDPVSGNFVVSDPVVVDESSYGTWIPATPSAAAKAEETGIRISIAHAKQSGYYGDAEFYPIIKYGEEQRPAAYTKEPEYFYRFDRYVDGYPERSTVTGDYPSLGNYTVQIQVTDPVSGNSALSAAFAVSEGSYGTWIPAAPTNVAAVAEETGLRITYGHPAAGLYGDVLFIPLITYEDEERPASDTKDKNYFYRFDRAVDGYPEKSDVAGDYPSLGNYAIQIQVLNTASGYTALSDQVTVDESLYKTWIPLTPVPAFSASGRTIAIAWRHPDNVYGNIIYDIQVAKQYQVDGSDDITDRTDPAAWFAPAANDSLIYALGDTYAALLAENDPANIGYAYHYGDLQVAWHTDAASRRIHGTAFTAMVPLDQQTVAITKTQEDGTPGEALGNSAKNTTYYFRLQAINLETGHMGEYSGDEGLGEAVTSCAINAQDVVANAINTAAVVPGSITAEKMFVKELAAISANMGVITDGALAGNAFNYWALSLILGQNGLVKYYPGEMRVGGSDQYFRVLPIVKDGILLDYHVEFKAGSFTVESSLSKISGEVIVTLNDNALDRTRITPKGTFYEHRSTPESPWVVIAQMTTAGVKSRNLYSDDSIVITNSQITDRRKNGSDIGLPYLTPASEVYHFDTDFNNQKGLSTIDLDYDGAQPSLVDESDNNDAIDFSTAILAVSPYSEIGKSIYGQFLLTCVFNSNVFTTEFWLKYVWNENQILFSIGNINDTIVLQLLNDEPYYNDVFDDDVPYNAEVLESDQLVYNDIQYAHGELVHQWQGGSETIDLDSLDIKFEEEKWYHLAVVQTATTLSLYINKIKVDFTRKSSGQSQVDVNINESKGSVIIDELMIDKTAALPFDDFADNTINKIPYAALDANDNWLVMDAKNPNKVKMNWLSSDVFRDAVLAIVQNQ